jgi:hypothetical protein
MKFAVIRLACFLSRPQTLCRAIAVASRIVHGILHSPPTCFGVESPLKWWRNPGRMRSLTDGVCIKLLTRLSHNQGGHYHPSSLVKDPYCLAGLRGLELANVIFAKRLKYWANSLWFAEHFGT